MIAVLDRERAWILRIGAQGPSLWIALNVRKIIVLVEYDSFMILVYADKKIRRSEKYETVRLMGALSHLRVCLRIRFSICSFL
jgi:hypothetical protein